MTQKKKFQHKGTSHSKRNLFSECFPNPQEVGGPEAIEPICKACKNVQCVRAGHGYLEWEKRMDTQVEYLLNNPILSDLTSVNHKIISDIVPIDLKQKHESLTVNTGTGWEDSSVGYQEETVPIVIPNFRSPKPLEPPTPVIQPPPQVLDPMTLMKKVISAKNTTTGPIMVGGVQKPKEEDAWTNSDKTVKPGAKVTLK